MKRPLPPRSIPLLLTLALNVADPPLSPAQQDSARITGSVRSSINGLPIPGVMVALRGSRVFDVSDSLGAFTLRGLPSGHQMVRVLYRDTLSYEREVTLKRGKTLTLSVLLDLDAVELSPIVVAARSLRAEHSLAGFYDRKKWGFGRFYTFEDLQRRPALNLRMLLGETGVQVRCGLAYCLPVSLSAGRYCVMSVLLDGMRLPPEELDLIHVDDLAGVEVYKRGFEVPVEYQFGFGSSCGAVLMWSRR